MPSSESLGMKGNGCAISTRNFSPFHKSHKHFRRGVHKHHPECVLSLARSSGLAPMSRHRETLLRRVLSKNIGRAGSAGGWQCLSTKLYPSVESSVDWIYIFGSTPIIFGKRKIFLFTKYSVGAGHSFRSRLVNWYGWCAPWLVPNQTRTVSSENNRFVTFHRIERLTLFSSLYSRAYSTLSKMVTPYYVHAPVNHIRHPLGWSITLYSHPVFEL